MNFYFHCLGSRHVKVGLTDKYTLLFLYSHCFKFVLCISVFLFTGLADIMKQLLTKYDNLFEVSFPYSMGWHGKAKKGKYAFLGVGVVKIVLA